MIRTNGLFLRPWERFRAAIFGSPALAVLALVSGVSALPSQELSRVEATLTTVPRLVRVSSSFHPVNGLPPATVESITVAIYSEQEGGSPLWQETQNVELDTEGHYMMLMGSTQKEGIPADIFASGEPRWLAVQFNRSGEVEQARVLMASVPYALRAADADTLGGRPASAFLLAPSTATGLTGEGGSAAPESTALGRLKPRSVTGTMNYIPYFTDSINDLGNSVLYQSGGNVGIGTTSPIAKLDLTGATHTSGIGSGTDTWLPFSDNSFYFRVPTSGFVTFDSFPSYSSVMRIAGSGSVGIGTTNFSAYGQTATLAVNGYAIIGGLRLNGGDALNNTIYKAGTIGISAGGSSILLNSSGGNVGIGTTTPSAGLEVSGKLKISGAGNALVFPDGSQQTTAAAGSGSNGSAAVNTQAIALLRWYPGNVTAQFSTGLAPVGVAYDGQSIWIANSGDNTVTRLRSNDGSTQGTFQLPTGTAPRSLAYDGANMWVAGYGANNITRLRGTDGTILGAMNAGANPAGLAFDGGNIWVASYGANSVTKLRAVDGVNLGTFNVGTNPIAVAFDGANVWVVNSGSNNITKLQASNGSLAGTYTVGTSPRGIAFDGSNLWVTNYGGNSVTEVRSSDGTILGTFAVGSNPSGVAFDGTYIWVANSGSNSVSKLRASDGSVQSTFPVGYAPNGVAFDGANVWVANSSSGTINKL